MRGLWGRLARPRGPTEQDGETVTDHSAEYDVPDLATRRGCAPKTEWLSGETYCDVHGREVGWPCAVTMCSSPDKEGE